MEAPARQLVELPQRRSLPAAVIAALRPRQWSKNLLVFAGIVFAAKLGDAGRWGEAVACFVAYCALSSAAYLVNDLRDLEHDRLHPVKRQRPIARGEVPVGLAVALAAVLTAVALGIGAWLGLVSLGFLLAFGALQLAYSFGLKHVVLLDVFAIGGLFVNRDDLGEEPEQVLLKDGPILISVCLWVATAAVILALT